MKGTHVIQYHHSISQKLFKYKHQPYPDQPPSRLTQAVPLETTPTSGTSKSTARVLRPRGVPRDERDACHLQWFVTKKVPFQQLANTEVYLQKQSKTKLDPSSWSIRFGGIRAWTLKSFLNMSFHEGYIIYIYTCASVEGCLVSW